MVMMKLHDSASGKLLSMQRVQSDNTVDLVGKTFAGVQLLRTGLHIQAELVKIELTSTPHSTVLVDGHNLCFDAVCSRY